MSLYHLVLLLALLVPLALDTFLLSAALELAGLPKEQRVRTGLTLVAFEAGMPIVGVLGGRGVGAFLGSLAGYTAAAVIGLAGVLLLRPGKDDKREHERLKLLTHARGLAAIDLGISISVDELALGVSLGLLQVPLLVAVIFVGVQSFAAAQLGFWLGGRLNEQLREGAEQVAGAALVAIAIALIVFKVTGHQL
ncbi:MAG TPA: manganese efflux pump [bacterium]|nr:manganese efflux pump [bacterium]